jgi:thiamine-monophosphate kinase
VKVREMGEDALIAAFAEIYQARTGVVVGIGDDGAIVELQRQRQVITTDIASEDVHFNRAWSHPVDIGAKIAIANLADVYAMGALPRYFTVALACSGDEEVEDILEIARGIETMARAHGVSIVGGDVVAAEQLVISITALGEIQSPVLRSGAKVGDHIFVTQLPGKSLGGLLLLSKGLANIDSLAARMFQRPDFRPEALVDFGFTHMSALMDVSDGLISDLAKIASASNVGINLDFDEEILSELSELAQRTGNTALELFLKSGEEHSFIVVIPQERLAQVPNEWIRIGVVTSGGGITLRSAPLPSTATSWHWQ